MAVKLCDLLLVEVNAGRPWRKADHAFHGAIYDASGKIQCSAGKPPLDQWCDFRVVRHFASGSGSAQIWIAHTGTPRHRVLHYANRRFTTDDGAGISAKRQDDNWLVSVGGREFYLIPDALIHGG